MDTFLFPFITHDKGIRYIHILLIYIYIYIHIYIINIKKPLCTLKCSILLERRAIIQENCRNSNNVEKVLSNKPILLEHKYQYQKHTL